MAWVGLPGEIFTELGMMIKLGSPFQYTIVASLANGSIGYVPDRKAYPQGAYEPVSARCAAGSGEMLVDAATRLLVMKPLSTRVDYGVRYGTLTLAILRACFGLHSPFRQPQSFRSSTRVDRLSI